MEPSLRTDQETARIAPLVSDIINDAQKLVRAEIELVRRELEVEWTKAKFAVTSFALAVVTLGVAGLLFGLFLSHGLSRLSGLPLWGCFGIFTIVFGVIGLFLFKKGRDGLNQIKFVTLDSAKKENVKWIKSRT